MTSADRTTRLSRARIRELLRGTVSYAGRLDRLSHEEFVDTVVRHGGRYVPYKHRSRIGLIVVGAADLPITPQGEPIDFHGRCAVGESEFLAVTGFDPSEDADEGYTVQSLAELLAVPPRRIRAWYKAGLVHPRSVRHGVMRFDFRQASIARTLVNLHAAGVTVARLRQSLLSLRRCLPEVDEPLEQLTTLERHGAMLLRLESGDLTGCDGQLWLDFDQAGHLPPIRLHDERPLPSAQEWHEQGVEQEQLGMMAEAEESYRRALEVGGPDEQVNFDLAYLLARQGERQQAMERYAMVLEMNPCRADAWNNLGVLLTETGRPDDGIAALRRSVALQPHDADAHYNLADALEEAGLESEAGKHFNAHLRLDRSINPWTVHARSNAGR